MYLCHRNSTWVVITALREEMLSSAGKYKNNHTDISSFYEIK